MKRTALKYRRTAIPALFFALVALLTVRLEFPLPGDAALLTWLSRLDPLPLIPQIRFGDEFPTWFWLPLITILVTLLLGRLFCGWLCPVGGLLGLLHSIRSRLFRRAAFKMPPGVLGAVRYYWLALLLTLVLIGTSWPLILTPYVLLSHETTRLWHGQVPWLLLAAVAPGLLFFPRFWCAYLCPTGLFLSIPARFRLRRFVAGENCRNCGSCTAACPVQAAPPAAGSVAEQCLLCGRCMESCAHSAVYWGAGNADRTVTDGVTQSRRDFFKAGAAAAAASAIWLYHDRPAHTLEILRPPGALPEEDFAALCNRCGRCIKVCPTRALWPLPLAAGLIAFETPAFIPRKGRCELCMLCQEVCPTGAIRRTSPDRIKIGTAVLDQGRCLAWADDTECLICVEQCPFQAVQMDEKRRPFVREDKCTGCGACENCCAVEEPAIVVRKDPGSRLKRLI